MISVLRTTFLAALRKVAQMRSDAPPPNATTHVVRLQTMNIPDQFLDISLSQNNLVCSVAIPCRGTITEPWGVSVRWLPLHDYVAAEDRTAVLQLDRQPLWLAIHADHTNAVFQSVPHKEEIYADEKANSGVLPQQ